MLLVLTLHPSSSSILTLSHLPPHTVADNMFIVPTRLGSSGWKFKIASIVLEVFQLGTLFPAAAFTHTDCIKWMAPLDVDLDFARWLVVSFGYAYSYVIVVGSSLSLWLFRVCPLSPCRLLFYPQHLTFAPLLPFPSSFPLPLVNVQVLGVEQCASCRATRRSRRYGTRLALVRFGHSHSMYR